MIEQILQADRMLQVDQVEQARDMYQRVVDLDPGNAIAVVGLAQCALADGDDAEAYRLASRALEIDPQNDMARRMEARLSEIMATRGEGVERPEAAHTAPAQAMRPVVTETTPVSGADTGTPTATSEDTETPAADGGSTPRQANAPATPAPATPSPTTRPAMRKSLFDRLLGR